MDLSIITAAIPERVEMLGRLAKELSSQARGLPVEHVVVASDGTIGRKMDAGFRAATGRYVAVVDDDDWIVGDYISNLLAEIASGPDVVTFDIATVDGRKSLAGDNANHLCAWRRELALTAPCLPRNYGWDEVWRKSLLAAHNLRETYIPVLLYDYRFSRKLTRAQSPASIADSLDNNGHRIRILRLHDGRLAAGPSMDRMWVPGMEMLNLSDLKNYEELSEVVFE